ncbi:acetylglutamate kinase [Zavarzinia aquatilis]|uniref:Acetylglutamate kinase n=1 Tax=Zavarzinia aquatilis TaxID=2211142 RepID=A0A317ED39_9PROT|nr:acetylglutamate kinase [Zavarzinia aquatilis]PWR24186.1 acetylglutamate kinase [Zavarzinia aquatilis]
MSDKPDTAAAERADLKLRTRWLHSAATITEALPYMRRYADSSFVVKYGGHAMGDDAAAKAFARDIVLLKQVGINPIVVHGGGPQIGKMLERLGIKSSFIDGLRVTDQPAVEVVEMVLAGSINKQIVGAINAAGGNAIGISGKDGPLIRARKLTKTKRDPESNIEKVLDYGFVGEPESVDPRVLYLFERSDFIPVVAPIGISEDGDTYNINADTAAGAIASAMRASRFLLLTDVPGVLDKDGKLIDRMTAQQARALIADGTIHGGMIPKVETCLDAVDNGVEAAVILDGRTPHALLLETFTAHGAGTMIENPAFAGRGTERQPG